jgi:hypothetical protein
VLGAAVWLFLRAVLVAGGGGIHPHVTASVALVAIAGVTVFLDMRRMREVLFLEDLGVSRGALAVTVLAPVATLELAARVLVPWMGWG